MRSQMCGFEKKATFFIFYNIHITTASIKEKSFSNCAIKTQIYSECYKLYVLMAHNPILIQFKLF